MEKANRTKKKISKALLEMLREKTLDEITVGELISYAGVGRSTFYRHYHDIYEVYESMLEDFLDRIVSYVAKFMFTHKNPDKLGNMVIDLQKVLTIFSKNWQVNTEGIFFKDDMKVLAHIINSDDEKDFFRRFYEKTTGIFKRYIMENGQSEETAEFYGAFIAKVLITTYAHDFAVGNNFSVEPAIAIIHILKFLNSGGEL